MKSFLFIVSVSVSIYLSLLLSLYRCKSTFITWYVDSATKYGHWANESTNQPEFDWNGHIVTVSIWMQCIKFIKLGPMSNYRNAMRSNKSTDGFVTYALLYPKLSFSLASGNIAAVLAIVCSSLRIVILLPKTVSKCVSICCDINECMVQLWRGWELETQFQSAY